MGPGEFPGDPEPGLIECATPAAASAPRIASRQPPRQEAARLTMAVIEPGRDGDAEQVAKRLAGAVAGQELPVPQVRSCGGQPGPVLDRGGYSRWRRRGGEGAAGAAARADPVLGDQRPDVLRQVEHLAPLDPGHLRA